MHSLEEIFDADLMEKPGIYSFYYRPQIADFDLYIDDDEQGSDKITQIIDKRIISPMCNRNLKMDIKVDFEQRLMGNVNTKFKSILNKNFNSKIIENAFSAKSEFESVEMRVFFNKMMKQLSADFFSPIYIGVSHNIKERIEEHNDNFFSAKAMMSQNAVLSESDFGTRVAKFAESNEVFFAVEYINNEGLGNENSYKMAMIMEWILNQQNTPILGKK